MRRIVSALFLVQVILLLCCAYSRACFGLDSLLAVSDMVAFSRGGSINSSVTLYGFRSGNLTFTQKIWIPIQRYPTSSPLPASKALA